MTCKAFPAWYAYDPVSIKQSYPTAKITEPLSQRGRISPLSQRELISDVRFCSSHARSFYLYLQQPFLTLTSNSGHHSKSQFKSHLPSRFLMLHHFLLNLVILIYYLEKESDFAQSCPTLCNPTDCSLLGSSIHPWDFPGKSTRVGCHFLLQGKFPTQGSYPGLQHYRQLLLPSKPPGKSAYLSLVALTLTFLKIKHYFLLPLN